MEPANNDAYKSKEYWDTRFAQEDDYDWLVSYDEIAALIGDYLKPDDRILVVGCGNSNLSFALWTSGRYDVTSIDYSHVVIERMSSRHSATPQLKWRAMDVRDMRAHFGAGSFDVVIDKATMDALVTDEKSPWTPDSHAVSDVDKMCREVQHVLREGGLFLQVTFQQPFFRKRYLLGHHVEQSYPWAIELEEKIPKGLGYYFFALRTL